MGLTEEAANKIAQRYNSDLIAELSDEIAALERETEGLMMLLSQDTIEEFAKANGGREVHRSWRDTMLRQGRNVPEVRMVWEELPMYDRNLDCTISKDAILDYTTWVLGKIALLTEQVT